MTDVCKFIQHHVGGEQRNEDARYGKKAFIPWCSVRTNATLPNLYYMRNKYCITSFPYIYIPCSLNRDKVYFLHSNTTIS